MWSLSDQNRQDATDAVRHIVEWDEEAERILLAAFKKHSYLVHQLRQCGEDDEDILQYLRIGIWMRLPRYNTRYCLTTFIFSSVRYLLLKRLEYLMRQRRAGHALTISLQQHWDDEDEECQLEIADPGVPLPEDQLVYQDMLEYIRSELSRYYPEQLVDSFLNHVLAGDSRPNISYFRMSRLYALALQAVRRYNSTCELPH